MPFGEDKTEIDIEQVAFGLLANREHTRSELTRKLKTRDFEPDLITRLLDNFETRGYLDDGRFTEQYVEMRIRKGYGPLRIRVELQERGVSSRVIDDWLDERDPDWRKRLREVSECKFGPLVDRSKRELGRRARFLEYRGFPTFLIRDLLFSD